MFPHVLQQVFLVFYDGGKAEGNQRCLLEHGLQHLVERYC
jgi:hypothetical protein